jgi:hypothetical protein
LSIKDVHVTSLGPESPVVARCAFAFALRTGCLMEEKRKKEVLELSRELRELDARWTDEAWGCAGRR